MRRESRSFLKLTAVVLVIVALVILDLAMTGGDVLAGVGQYGRHGGS